MARDPNQQFIYNDEEISLIKNTFAENDTLLYTVRKVLLQFPLTETEKNLIKLSVTPEVHAVLKKRILPEISDDFPLNQLPSILTTLTEHLKVKTVEEMAPLFEAKRLEIDYLAQQFDALANIEKAGNEEIKLADMAVIKRGPPENERELNYVRMHAYLFLLGYIDPMLGFIKSIAGEKKETVEEAKKRMDRNSSK